MLCFETGIFNHQSRLSQRQKILHLFYWLIAFGCFLGEKKLPQIIKSTYKIPMRPFFLYCLSKYIVSQFPLFFLDFCFLDTFSSCNCAESKLIHDIYSMCICGSKSAFPCLTYWSPLNKCRAFTNFLYLLNGIT